MSQQNLDLRRSIQIVRRHKRLFGGAAALGLLGGAAYAVLNPPMLTSTALVVISQSAANNNSSSQSGTSGSDTLIATQMVIATSDPVLAGALPHVSPAISLQTLESRVSVASVDQSSIISVSATGKTAGLAEATANAVANSYVAYVSAATSPVVHADAKVLEPATTATGTKRSEQVAIWTVLGALVGAIVGFIISLALGRSDRRLRERDAIANSIAAPVLASIPVEHPSDPMAWVRLLEEYEPAAVHGYGLSKLLQQFSAAESALGNGAGAKGSSLTVLSLSTDPTALALGPQLASFAAAQGIPTALVVGPQQDMNVTATLRTACAAPPQPVGRGRPLRLVVSDDRRLGQLRAAFVVVVAVVDSQEPHIPDTVRTAATVLGVSAGGATAEQLARAATVAAVDGRDIDGILVANPDPDDQTSGRIPRLMPMRRALPTRINGRPTTEIRR